MLVTTYTLSRSKHVILSVSTVFWKSLLLYRLAACVAVVGGCCSSGALGRIYLEQFLCVFFHVNNINCYCRHDVTDVFEKYLFDCFHRTSTANVFYHKLMPVLSLIDNRWYVESPLCVDNVVQCDVAVPLQSKIDTHLQTQSKRIQPTTVYTLM